MRNMIKISGLVLSLLILPTAFSYAQGHGRGGGHGGGHGGYHHDGYRHSSFGLSFSFWPDYYPYNSYPYYPYYYSAPYYVSSTAYQPIVINQVAASSADTSTDDVFTLNIPNDQGGYVGVVIKRSGNGFVGPQGEYYAEFPKVSQLKMMYAK